MRVPLNMLIVVLMSGCLEPEEVRRLEQTVDVLDDAGLDLPSLAELPGVGPRPGSRCDLSFGGPAPCGYTMWCAPTGGGLQKVGDGRLGKVGVCTERGMPGAACERDAHCLGPFHCAVVDGHSVCVDPTPLALPERPVGREPSP